MAQFESKDHKDLGEIFMLAKNGNKTARQFLKERYSLTIFTEREVDMVNAYRDQGMTIEQAINRMREEIPNE